MINIYTTKKNKEREIRNRLEDTSNEVNRYRYLYVYVISLFTLPVFVNCLRTKARGRMGKIDGWWTNKRRIQPSIFFFSSSSLFLWSTLFMWICLLVINRIVEEKKNMNMIHKKKENKFKEFFFSFVEQHRNIILVINVS